jgi:thiamine biosynthesis lipoprotein
LNLAAPIGTVVLTDAAIATSGVDFRRWYQNGKLQHHLIDPRTGQPAITDVQTTTIIHSMATLAEAYAKAVILLGSQAGLDWINRQPQKAALVVRNDGAVLATSNFESKLIAVV